MNRRHLSVLNTRAVTSRRADHGNDSIVTAVPLYVNLATNMPRLLILDNSNSKRTDRSLISALSIRVYQFMLYFNSRFIETELSTIINVD